MKTAFPRILSLVVLIVSFSCSSDGNGNPITGKWNYVAQYENDVLIPESFCRAPQLEIRSDGRFTRYIYDYVTPSVPCGTVSVESGSWEMTEEGQYHLAYDNSLITPHNLMIAGSQLHDIHQYFNEDGDWTTSKTVYQRAVN